MSRIRRPFVGLVAVALVLIAAPVSADDAPADEVFVAQAAADGASLTVLGQDVLDVSSTAAGATVGEAAAAAVPAGIAGTPVGERTASSQGATVRDPADEADVCAIAVPAPVSSILDLGVLCAEAEATGDVPAAAAEASAGEVGVLDLDDAALGELAGLLDALGVEAVLAQLSAAVGDELTEEVFDGLVEGCQTVLGDLEDEGGLIGGIVGELLGVLDDVLAALGDATTDDLAELAGLLDDLDAELQDGLPSLCDALATLIDGGLPEVDELGSLTDAVLGEGQALLEVQLLGTASEVDADDDTVLARADGGSADTAVGLTLSLGGLDAALESVLEGGLDGLLGTLESTVEGTPLAGELPGLSDLVDEVLGQSDLLGTLLGEDLLSIAVTPGDAEVVLDRAAGTFTSSATAAVVELGGPLLAVSDALNDLVGTVDESLLGLLRDSPLADLVSVSLVSEETGDEDVNGLPGHRATSGAANVTLLGAVEGGIVVDVVAATAAVGHDALDPVETAGPDPEPVGDEPDEEPDEEEPTLPATGGGGLLLGLLALGGMTALRRRP